MSSRGIALCGMVQCVAFVPIAPKLAQRGEELHGAVAFGDCSHFGDRDTLIISRWRNSLQNTVEASKQLTKVSTGACCFADARGICAFPQSTMQGSIGHTCQMASTDELFRKGVELQYGALPSCNNTTAHPGRQR